MPLTTLDPVTALVVIDLQAGVVGRDGAPHAMSEVEVVSLLKTTRA